MALSSDYIPTIQLPVLRYLQASRLVPISPLESNAPNHQAWRLSLPCSPMSPHIGFLLPSLASPVVHRPWSMVYNLTLEHLAQEY